MTFCVLSERDVLAKMKRAKNKNQMLTVVADLTGCRRDEMAEWLRNRGMKLEGIK